MPKQSLNLQRPNQKKIKQKKNSQMNWVLNQLWVALGSRSYKNIRHARISVMYSETNGDENELTGIQHSTSELIHGTSQERYRGVYQGLSHAHLHGVAVLVKWQWDAGLSTGLGRDVAGGLQREMIVHRMLAIEFSLPCVVPLLDSVHSLDSTGGLCNITILTMPWVSNGSMARWLKLHPYPFCSDSCVPVLELSLKLSLSIALAHALARLHASGWYHGDLKPSNILLVKTGDADGLAQCSNAFHDVSSDSSFKVWLSDFALSGIVDDLEAGKPAEHIAGTAAYLAPECWQGGVRSFSSDQYAFGLVFYELFSGTRAFSSDTGSSKNAQGASVLCWREQHIHAPIPNISIFGTGVQQTGINSSLNKILNRLLAKSPEARYKDMMAVMAELQMVLRLLKRCD